ncbi:MAG: MraY family glycosyltransferase [Erysipelotrichaceae bacterium]
MDWLMYLGVPFLLSAAITPLIKKIACYLGIYAEMNERTVHTKAIARIGGVAIYVSFMIGMACFMKVDASINAIVLGGTIMFVGGLVDDMDNLKPIYKFGFQTLAAIVLMVVGDVYLEVIRLPFNITINMGLITFLVTFLWITGITNAVNLIDGLDGLAGGLSVIILVVVASLSVIEQRADISTLSLILAGATLGFLIYNSHPASIFMGDCGALFLGFVISAISLLGFKSSTLITLGLPILMLTVPIVDTISAILRRVAAGHKFSEADKNHLHHVLMRRFGHRNTVLILYGVTALFGVTAYVYIINKLAGLITLFIICIVIEIFIETSGMISPSYHPILSVLNRLKGKDSPDLLKVHPFEEDENKTKEEDETAE